MRQMPEGAGLIIGSILGAILWALIVVVYFMATGCSTTGNDYIMPDPIFQNSNNSSKNNMIIYRADGCTDYLVADPIFEDEENFILFRGRCD